MDEFIRRVNELLDSYGSEAIQEYDAGYDTLRGYSPAYVFRAIREAGGIIRRTQILQHGESREDRSWTAWAIVEATLRTPDGEVITLQHVGNSRSNTAPGEALKGAITNALEKALSVIGVGEKAYMGLLSQDRGVEKTSEKPTSATSARDYPPMATVNQINRIAALGRTIKAHPEIEKQYGAELQEFREQMRRGMTKKEASAFISWCEQHGIMPTWEGEDG